MQKTYKKDILGNGFEQLTITQPNDYEGKIICTLVRRKCPQLTHKAVLYVHGFNDYFFQREMAEKFNQEQVDFYAIDLRKYGRSHLAHQQKFNVHNLAEYDADIEKALQQIQTEQHTEVLLCGHSTGGLIVSLYAHKNPNSKLFHAIFANSPFFDFNQSYFLRRFIVPILSLLGKKFPNAKVPASFSDIYGQSTHKSKHGEWDYNIEWKPLKVKTVKMGFIRAIHQAQKTVHKGLHIKVPVLVMHADKTISQKKYSPKAHTGDSVLNVFHIRKNAEKIKGIISIISIENGLHDLVLSKSSVREEVYVELFKWWNQLKNSQLKIE